MLRSSRLLAIRPAMAVAFAVALGACDDSVTNVVPQQSTFAETKLVADAPGAGALTTDAALVNP